MKNVPLGKVRVGKKYKVGEKEEVYWEIDMPAIDDKKKPLLSMDSYLQLVQILENEMVKREVSKQLEPLSAKASELSEDRVIEEIKKVEWREWKNQKGESCSAKKLPTLQMKLIDGKHQIQNPLIYEGYGYFFFDYGKPDVVQRKKI